MLWFTSDLHLGHSNVIKYSSRPYSSVEEMDESIIENINDRVGKYDVFYILGDFSLVNNREKLKEYRARINCGFVALILGNHDHTIRKNPNDMGFYPVTEALQIKHDGQEIYMSHYAHRVWPKSHYGAWHLWGHSHGELPSFGLSFDVGVDPNNMLPLSFDDVKRRMESLSEAL